MKVGPAQVYKSYKRPSGIKTFVTSAIGGLIVGIPVISFWFWLPTSWQGQNNFAFVDNPKSPIVNPHNSSASFNDEGVPVSPGGSA